MNSESSSSLYDQYPDSLGADVLSIALIGPDEERRAAAVSALAGCEGAEIREFSSFPPSLDDVPRLLEQHYDVIIIDLDSHPEYALELVESICANGSATVMVYSVKADSELLVRCMRAGAREFLTLPFTSSTMAEALVRASARRPAPRLAKKTGGRLLAFLGAKGGDGVTTLASNFAVALAQESSKSTLLIDLDLPLGDAALNLGIAAEYSTVNALQNASRLDTSFLSKLLVKHSSGVFVLAAPGKFPQFNASNDAIDKLIAVARQEFDNVVIDMGSRLDLMGTSLFKAGSTVYLVIQAGIAGLRNSNRLISQYFTTEIPKLEIVINRYEPRSIGLSEDQITKALTRPAQWKIPNDYTAVQRMQNTAIPLALEDSPISRLIRQMARSACGLAAIQRKRTGFSLKSLSRSISARLSPPAEAPAFTQLGLAHGQDNAGTTADADRPHSKMNIPRKSVHAAPTMSIQPAERTQKSLKQANIADHIDPAEEKQGDQKSVSTFGQQIEVERRTYNGATYVKGADGEWHLKKTQASVVDKVTPAIAWSTPTPIDYGTALDATQLNATASVPGSLAYTPAEGAVLAAGEHMLSATFTPADPTHHNTAQASVSLTVTKSMPVIEWPKPISIVYGTKISAIQLNATASVPGSFVYTPAEGAVLSAGTHTPSVIFTPADTTNYTAAQAVVSLIVTKAKPAITWPAPAPIAYGTEIGAQQLNATASVSGTFVYTPAAGTVLAAGTHTLSVTLTPMDTTDYAEVQATVSLTVLKAKPTVITWPTPAAIFHGTALSAAQLNATAPVPGTFVYTPSAGEVLATGKHALSVTFKPADTNFPEAQASVSLTVNKATPTITWPEPAAIAYGTALSAAQLNATAPVPGTFVYTPSVGEVLATGRHALSVTFTPADTADEATAQATVSLTVAKATPIITWQAPAAVSYGTAICAAQLNATALVPGTFVYTPAANTVLTAGMQTLSVTFTPTDTANYTTAQATVPLVVEGLTNIASLMPAEADAYPDHRGLADASDKVSQSGSNPSQQSKLETRTYKGATYVKGADGQWYLQKK